VKWNKRLIFADVTGSAKKRPRPRSSRFAHYGIGWGGAKRLASMTRDACEPPTWPVSADGRYRNRPVAYIVLYSLWPGALFGRVSTPVQRDLQSTNLKPYG